VRDELIRKPVMSIRDTARRVIAFGSLLLLLVGFAQAQTTPQRTALRGNAAPSSILWVGNSFFYYNNSMHNHVLSLVRANDAKTKARAVSVTISGSGIDWHDIASYFRPNGIGRYSFVGDNEIVFNKPGRQFDAVIIMDCSQCPIHPQLQGVFHEYAKKQSDIVRANGAQPIFFMSWPYKDKPDMGPQLAEQYTLAGNENDALVIPAGIAFSNAIAKRPELEFYQPDKRHPTLIGTYLAACTAYAAIYRKSPVGNAYTAGIDARLARFLQEIAWDTVESYYRRS
jgi:hypothetical protein